MAKILGIDYGSSKIGLALADTETKLAVPFKVIETDNLKAIIQELAQDTEDLEKIVVGLPLGLSGLETAQTKEVKKFIEELKKSSGLAVEEIDERLTTVAAKKAGGDDAVAAMYILQSYLDGIT